MSTVVSFIQQIILGISRASTIRQMAQTLATYMPIPVQLAIDVAETFAWSGRRINWYWNNGLKKAFQAAEPTWENMGGDVYSITHRLITVIIPNSVKAGTSKNWAGINAVLKRVQADHHGLIVLNKYTRNTVEPQVTILQQEISGWLKFQQLWKSTYGPAVGALIDWLHHPGDLVKFLLTQGGFWKAAIPNLGGNRANADSLLKVLLSKAPDVTTAIDNATVAVLNSGSY